MKKNPQIQIEQFFTIFSVPDSPRQAAVKRTEPETMKNSSSSNGNAATGAGGGDLRKEFQRIQENNKSAFENEKPLYVKRMPQPAPNGSAGFGGAAAAAAGNTPRSENSSGGGGGGVITSAAVRIRQHDPVPAPAGGAFYGSAGAQHPQHPAKYPASNHRQQQQQRTSRIILFSKKNKL